MFLIAASISKPSAGGSHLAEKFNIWCRVLKPNGKKYINQFWCIPIPKSSTLSQFNLAFYPENFQDVPKLEKRWSTVG